MEGFNLILIQSDLWETDPDDLKIKFAEKSVVRKQNGLNQTNANFAVEKLNNNEILHGKLK